jgi:hypothetical protein
MIQRIPIDPDEVARQGAAIFDRSIAALAASRDPQDYVVIDIISGDFEIAEKSITATRKLKERHPTGVLWGRFVGTPVSVRLGSMGSME